MQELESQHDQVRQRMEAQLRQRIEAAKAEDVGEFMHSMRSRLGDGSSKALNRRLHEISASRQRSRQMSRQQQQQQNGRRNYDVLQVHHSRRGTPGDMGLGVSGQSAATHDRLPSIASQKQALRSRGIVPKKAAAASARRAQKIIRDRNPRAAHAVAEASLDPQYQPSPSVLGAVYGTRPAQ